MFTNHWVAMTRDGRRVALRRTGGIDVVDVASAAPRRHLAAADDAAFAWVGGELWVADDALRRLGPGDVPVASELPERIACLSPASGCDGGAIATGARAWWIERGEVAALPGGAWFALDGRRALVALPERAELRTVGRGHAIALPSPRGRVASAAALFGGRVIAMWVCGGQGDALIAVSANGALVHRVTVPALAACAFAESAGLAIAALGDELCAIDLRYGRVRTLGRAPHAVRELAIDADGHRLVIAGPPDDTTPAMVTLASCDVPRGRPDRDCAADLAHQDCHG